MRVGQNVNIWQFYVDLECNIGTVESAKAAYYEMINLKLATPQIFLNFANFL